MPNLVQIDVVVGSCIEETHTHMQIEFYKISDVCVSVFVFMT